MNISELLTNIKMDLGIYAIALPFDNPDQVLEDVIKTKTLRTFSTFCPDMSNRVKWNLKDLEVLKREANATTYLLPDVFHYKKLLGIRSVTYDDTNINGLTHWGGVPMSGNMINASMIANMSAKLSGKMMPKMTFKFVHPRELTLYNCVNSCTVVVELMFQHDDNLLTITPTSEESFIELATLDIKRFLYNALKHYNELPSAFGVVNLRIDDWSQAEADRKQLIEEWSSLYHVDILAFEWG